MQISLPALPFRSFDQRANAVASRALTRICDLRNSGEQRKIEDVCVRQIREKRRGGGERRLTRLAGREEKFYKLQLRPMRAALSAVLVNWLELSSYVSLFACLSARRAINSVRITRSF